MQGFFELLDTNIVVFSVVLFVITMAVATLYIVCLLENEEEDVMKKCKSCHSQNNYLTGGICQECAWKERGWSDIPPSTHQKRMCRRGR